MELVAAGKRSLWAGFPPTVILVLLLAAPFAFGQSGQSVLGLKVGMSLDEARSVLEKLGGEGGGVDTRGGGRREAYSFKTGAFMSVAFRTKGKTVSWVSGFLREGHEIPFESLGDLSKAVAKSDSEAIWNLSLEGDMPVRLVAKGGGGKARVIYLLSLETKPPS
ncbi:MAG TPA: hypothetical protein VEX38_02880 [Fimbriimonadaceae bacterium]|nr:hypothetical protein [Fimbriimonadaceae bacterium]